MSPGRSCPCVLHLPSSRPALAHFFALQVSNDSLQVCFSKQPLLEDVSLPGRRLLPTYQSCRAALCAVFTHCSMLIAGVALLALAVAALFALRAVKRRRARRVISVSAREAQELYRMLEKVLAQKGKARPAHVTPEAHARALRDSGFAAASAVEQVTELYLRARYGTLELPREHMSDLKRRIDDVKRAA